MALVSVLFPNYNNAPYLRECLDSLLAQQFQDFVVWFVDDCSTDNSVEIVASYKNDKFRIIRKDFNSGIVDTMNEALKRIDTKYFIRMDGDDISTPDRFRRLVEYMEAHPGIGVCSSDIQTFGSENEAWIFERDPEMNKARLIFGHGIGHASSIFRTSVFKENNLVYESQFWRMEDYLLFYRLKNLTLTTSIPGTYYHYRKGDYNTSTEIWNKKIQEFRRFYAMIFSDLGMPFGDKDIEIHLEMNRIIPVSRQLSEYKQHVEKIARANARNMIFPGKELKLVLTASLRNVCYKLIQEKKAGFGELVPHFLKSGALFRYYFMMRFIHSKRQDA